MTQQHRQNNQKRLFKRALATYTPGMSCRQLAAALQVSQYSARQFLYTIRDLALSESL